MKKIAFIADIFKEQYVGGGESNDDVLIKYLSVSGYKVDKVQCKDMSRRVLDYHHTFIIGNFIQLSEEYKSKLSKKKYIVYEHDHKYLSTRDPSIFPNFVAPPPYIINQLFYQNAHAVVVLSKICKEIIQINLNLDNIHNIGCSLWTDEKLNYINSLLDTIKTKDYAIVGSSNPVKGFMQSVRYCNENNISFDVIQPCNEKELLKRLSLYKILVFFPQVLETFCRLTAEAKMLNCKLLTKKKMLGFASEKCFSLNGKELLDDITFRRNNAYELFLRLIQE